VEREEGCGGKKRLITRGEYKSVLGRPAGDKGKGEELKTIHLGGKYKEKKRACASKLLKKGGRNGENKGQRKPGKEIKKTRSQKGTKSRTLKPGRRRVTTAGGKRKRNGLGMGGKETATTRLSLLPRNAESGRRQRPKWERGRPVHRTRKKKGGKEGAKRAVHQNGQEFD